MPSSIEQLFEQLFGYVPAKEGEAYERLAAAVCKLLSSEDSIFHDKRLRGLLSQTLYQIDVLKDSQGQQHFGEAKDYTDRTHNKKVGRPDLQKMGGALPELPVEGGLFFSATDYTKPATKYADAAEGIVGKPIELFHLRPSTQEDEQGRIATIVIEMVIGVPDYANARFQAVFTEEGHRKAETLAEKGGSLSFGDNRICIDTIYKANGETACTIEELTAKGFPHHQEDVAEATYVLPDCAVRCGDDLLPIQGLSYRVPFLKSTREVRISAKGTAVLLVKDEKGEVNKLITDADIRRVSFGDNGEAVIDH